MIRVLTQITLAAILVVAVWSVSIQWAYAQTELIDPAINNHVNVMARRIAEEYKRQTMLAEWNLLKWYEISSTVPNDTTVLVDPARAGEGLTPVTGADLHNLMYTYTQIYQILNDPAVKSTVSKFCVRSDDVIFGQ